MMVTVGGIEEEENRALASQTVPGIARGAVDRDPSCVGRDSVDSAQRDSLAGPAAGGSDPPHGSEIFGAWLCATTAPNHL